MAKEKLSVLEQPQKEYGGIIKLENRLVIFEGSIVPLANITRVMHQVIPAPISISLPLLLTSEIAAIVSVILILTQNQLFIVIAFVISVCVAAYGIWERCKPSSYGLIIELVSGTCYYFISKEHAFIQGSYTAFADAIQKGFNFIANFQNLNYTIMKDIKGSTIVNGDNIGSIKGGTYTEYLQSGKTEEPNPVIKKVSQIIANQQHAQASDYWNKFVAELGIEQPDKLKLSLLLEKVHSLINNNSIGDVLQSELNSLIEKKTTP